MADIYSQSIRIDWDNGYVTYKCKDPRTEFNAVRCDNGVFRMKTPPIFDGGFETIFQDYWNLYSMIPKDLTIGIWISGTDMTAEIKLNENITKITTVVI